MARTVDPICARRTFESLRHATHRGRSGPIGVSFVEERSWRAPRVGYAISRRVGTAVVRNRLRRRARAIVGERGSALPVGAYLVRVGTSAPALSYEELKVAMHRALERAVRPARAPRSSAPGAERDR